MTEFTSSSVSIDTLASSTSYFFVQWTEIADSIRIKKLVGAAVTGADSILFALTLRTSTSIVNSNLAYRTSDTISTE